VISAFCDWLVATSLSRTFQDWTWFVPTVQSVHILSIAVVLTTVAMTDLKLLGLHVGSQSLSEMVSQTMPWVWIALCLLLATGILLTITEPARELLNNVFRLKMLLVLALVSILKMIQSGVRGNPDYFTLSPRHRWAGRAVGAASLVLGVCIVIAGRWIAYV
jgi:magnesium-transporting ATPase (P-type)